MKGIKIAGLIILAVTLVTITHPGVIHAQPLTMLADLKGDASGGVNQVGGGGVSINAVIQDVVNVLSVVVGIASVIVIIVSGLRFVTSGGDSSAVASARTALIYALVGIAVVALAQVLVHTVLTTVAGPAPPKK